FNANLIKAAQRFAEEHKPAATDFLLIGRKGRDFYRKRDVPITGEHLGMAKVQYADASAIAQTLMERFRNEEIDAVYLLYNEFKSVMAQRVTLTQVLPVELPQQTEPVDFIFDTPPLDMLASLLPRYVEISLYRALLESAAAEHAARMTAMDAATSNASDMIDTLTLYMNRVRQASITKEIIEVVSGAAAAE
ncbi:MAG TPA: ATP synthase F1 subunit gamma, partial [Bryobacteraceae bacterium]|nr:ATP synthase F1 subunit gamma [Bryobacteraceae bacterium]